MIDDNFEIKFNSKYVHVRVVDTNGFPKETWSFDRSDLTDLERVFVSNIKSMTKSIITDQENNEKNK